MEHVNETLKRIVKQDRDFFEEAFKGYSGPEDIKNASIAICRSYGIRGVCDPMYIANVIAKNIGRGNGKSNFF